MLYPVLILAVLSLGALGLVVKPVSGLLDSVANVTAGIADGSVTERTRSRLPRLFPENWIIPYDCVMRY